MKTKLTTLVCALFFITLGNFATAQTRDFDGLWSGNIEKDDGSTLEMTIYIVDNNVYATYYDSDGDLAKDLNKEVIWSKGFGQQLNFVWMNAGGVWTETQFFSLVWVTESKLSVYYTRHVSNESEEFDGNTDWGYSGKGYLYLD
jgi:hypothetical protein